MSKPFETTFATLRRGAASMEATEAMQQVVKSVYETRNNFIKTVPIVH